jgi:hypothetical protein
MKSPGVDAGLAAWMGVYQRRESCGGSDGRKIPADPSDAERYTLAIGAAQAAWSAEVCEVHLQRMPE